MVLFIFFNSIGCSVEQWKKNPYDGSIKSTLINKIKKIGNVYLYNPIFYNFNSFDSQIVNSKYSEEYEFTIDSLNIEKHCEKLFEKVCELDSQFVLISHDLGFIFAHIFATLYEKYVVGIININGAYTKNWFKFWLDKDKMEYIKKIKNKELNMLFENLKLGKKITETIKLLEYVVKYNLFKQYYKFCSDTNMSFDCEIMCFINTETQNNNNLEIIDKFNFCNKLNVSNSNVKIFNYLDKSNFIYFDIEKDIIDSIKNLINNLE